MRITLASNVLLATMLLFNASTIPVRAETKPTIVLVHGAWADGSSWDGVVWRLLRAGYTVDVPPNNLRGIATDSASLRTYLRTVAGPIVLAGHSYGGTVITNAAAGNSAVKALVYIDAFVPKQNETLAAEVGAFPGSFLAPSLKHPQCCFVLRAFSGAAPGVYDSYIRRQLFPSGFAADVEYRKAVTLAMTQRPLATSAIGEPSGPPAWKTIPSWDLIGDFDQLIPRAAQEYMARRAGSHIVHIQSSHASLISHPGSVSDIIIEAARSVAK